MCFLVFFQQGGGHALGRLRSLDPVLPAPRSSTPEEEEEETSPKGTEQKTTTGSGQVSAFAAAAASVPEASAEPAGAAVEAAASSTAAAARKGLAAAEVGAGAENRAPGTGGRVSFEISSIERDPVAEDYGAFRGQMITRAHSAGASSTGRSVYLMNDSSSSSFRGGGYGYGGVREEEEPDSSLERTMEVESMTPPSTLSPQQVRQNGKRSAEGCVPCKART